MPRSRGCAPTAPTTAWMRLAHRALGSLGRRDPGRAHRPRAVTTSAASWTGSVPPTCSRMAAHASIRRSPPAETREARWLGAPAADTARCGPRRLARRCRCTPARRRSTSRTAPPTSTCRFTQSEALAAALPPRRRRRRLRTGRGRPALLAGPRRHRPGVRPVHRLRPPRHGTLTPLTCPECTPMPRRVVHPGQLNTESLSRGPLDVPRHDDRAHAPDRGRPPPAPRVHPRRGSRCRRAVRPCARAHWAWSRRG